jgi:hypothetical protein
MGGFKLGSTIVMVFEAPRNFQFDIKEGELVKVGQPMGGFSLLHRTALVSPATDANFRSCPPPSFRCRSHWPVNQELDSRPSLPCASLNLRLSLALALASALTLHLTSARSTCARLLIRLDTTPPLFGLPSYSPLLPRRS